MPPKRLGGVVPALCVAGIFFAVVAGLCAAGLAPWLLLGAYILFSAAAFVAYGMDKSAAVKGAFRTSEATLHLLGVIGGWPGALVAQRVFRHKTQKRSFQLFFWFTVAVNCGVLAWFSAV